MQTRPSTLSIFTWGSSPCSASRAAEAQRAAAASVARRARARGAGARRQAVHCRRRHQRTPIIIDLHLVSSRLQHTLHQPTHPSSSARALEPNRVSPADKRPLRVCRPRAPPLSSRPFKPSPLRLATARWGPSAPPLTSSPPGAGGSGRGSAAAAWRASCTSCQWSSWCRSCGARCRAGGGGGGGRG